MQFFHRTGPRFAKIIVIARLGKTRRKFPGNPSKSCASNNLRPYTQGPKLQTMPGLAPCLL